jgi:Na+/melibiose symporter-like transporter
MAGFFNYNTKLPDAPEAIHGFRVCSGILVGLLFVVCCVLLMIYKLNKRLTLQMAGELAERRKQFQY